MVHRPRIVSRTSRILSAVMLATLAGACGPAEPEYTPEQLATGQKAYLSTCATCHGKDGYGLPKLGKSLHANAFLGERSDEEMVAFIKTGRPASDPLNTTGVDMPPKGGNPALRDDEIAAIIAYLRTLK